MSNVNVHKNMSKIQLLFLLEGKEYFENIRIKL